MGSNDPVDAAVQESLLALERERAAEGRFPYEGSWLTQEEIAERVAEKERRARVRFVQFCLLCAGMTALGLFVILVLAALCY